MELENYNNENTITFVRVKGYNEHNSKIERRIEISQTYKFKDFSLATCVIKGRERLFPGSFVPSRYYFLSDIIETKESFAVVPFNFSELELRAVKIKEFKAIDDKRIELIIDKEYQSEQLNKINNFIERSIKDEGNYPRKFYAVLSAINDCCLDLSEVDFSNYEQYELYENVREGEDGDLCCEFLSANYNSLQNDLSQLTSKFYSEEDRNAVYNLLGKTIKKHLKGSETPFGYIFDKENTNLI